MILKFKLDILLTSFVSDGLSLSEMGLSLVNFPIQIIHDAQLQQQVMSTETIPENSTAIYIPVDQNQVAYRKLPNSNC